LLGPLADNGGPTLTHMPAVEVAFTKINDTDPASNAIAAPLTTTLRLTFTENIDSSTVNTGTITAQGMMGGLLTGTYTTTANLVEFQPSRPLFPGELVRTTVVSTVQSIIVANTSSYQWQFNALETMHRPVIVFRQDIAASDVLTGVEYSSVAWGDYDNDGDLDILLTGRDSSNNWVAQVWRNDGGSFSNINAGLTGVEHSSVAWGDYDNDGDLDILLTGRDSSNTPVAQVWRNNGDDTFSNINAGLTGVYYGSVAWGDYDNDGDLDILLTGRDSSSNPVAQVWRNDGGSFSNINAGLTGVEFSSVDWGDYDNDGDLDILLTGYDGSGPVAQVWRNDGGSFSNINAGLTGVDSSSVAWGDYDNDGYLDILLTGYDGSGPVAQVWRNDGGGNFINIGASLTGVVIGSVAWGDYDNDGDLDILLSGQDSSSGRVAEVWRNDGGGNFTNIGAGLTGVYYSSVAWGDYDNDGDLDILLTGTAGSFSSGRVAEVWENVDLFVVTGSDPAPNNITAPLNTPLNITFSQNINSSTVNSGTISAHGMMGGLLTGTYSIVDDVVTLNPNRALFSGELVRTTVNTGVQNIVGTNVSSYQWQFNALETMTRPAVGFKQDTAVSTSLTGVYISSVAWGDYDNDGDLDILLSGQDSSSNRVAQVWRNDGGSFSNIDAGLTGVAIGSVAWGDYDNDGDLDILLTGRDSSDNRVAQVWRNDGGGNFTNIDASLTGVDYSSVAWGDYDNDGDLDILLTGTTNGSSSGSVAQVWRNDGGSFSNINAGLTGVYYGSVAWGDYDNDGYLDILLTGLDSSNNWVAEVWRNDGGDNFTKQDVPGLTGVVRSSVAWGDYDNDGYLDILLTGRDSSDNRVAQVWRNDGGGNFTNIGAGLTGVDRSSVAWGDYDNDGYLDILLTGNSSSGPMAEVWRNDGGGNFTNIGAGLTGVYFSSVAWGDYDNDGDLDSLLTGLDSSNNWVAEVWENVDLTDVCYATPDSGTTLFSSLDAQAVRGAITAANPGDTVKIGGTCAGAVLQSGTTQVALITETLTLSGGYVPTSTVSFWLQTPDPVANPTTLDAESNGRVLSTTAPATLQGLTLSNGAITGANGGGLYATTAITLTEMTLVNNAITGASSQGGGGAFFNGTATIISSTFQSNSVSGDNASGGGAWFAHASGTTWVTRTTFIDNTTLRASGVDSNGGGATKSGGGSISFYDTDFINNEAGNGSEGLGGGLYSASAGSVSLDQSRFEGNNAYRGGGANIQAPTTIANTVFVDNGARDWGGGAIFNQNYARTISNVLFAGNSATNLGAAIYVVDTSSLQIVHTTIASLAPPTGATQAVHVAGGTVNLSNTLIASHTTGIQQAGGTVSAEHTLFSDVTNQTAGTVTNSNPITGTPHFVDPANNNYRIGPDSAAVNAGLDAGVTTDFDGEARPQGAGFDIGYDELPQQCGLSTGVNYTFDNPAATLSFSNLGTVQCVAGVYMPRTHSNATGTPGGAGVGNDHFWQIGAWDSLGEPASGFVARMTLPHSITPDSNAKVCKFPGTQNGSGWDCFRTDSDETTVWLDGVTSFSDWAVGNEVGPTAVTLSSLAAAPDSTIPLMALATLFLLLLSGSWLVVGRRR
jgi:predicted outer membrane repeat protein